MREQRAAEEADLVHQVLLLVPETGLCAVERCTISTRIFKNTHATFCIGLRATYTDLLGLVLRILWRATYTDLQGLVLRILWC